MKRAAARRVWNSPIETKALNKTCMNARKGKWVIAGICCLTLVASATPPKESTSLSPTALARSPDGKTLFIACATANRVLVFDVTRSVIQREVPVPESPLGLTLSPDGANLYVTCAAPESTVCVIDVARAKVIERIPAGHTATAPVLSRDAKTLYICNRFNNEIAFIQLASGKTIKRVRVPREPVAAALTADGKTLLVADHLHAGRADCEVVASSVSLVDTQNGKLIRNLPLPNGSGLLRGIAISPDGTLACVTHLLSRFHLPTTQIERGWINNNALTLIDLTKLQIINTVLLDNIDSGAANPWDVAWTPDGQRIVVAHAGTHELSVIAAPALLAKLAKVPTAIAPNQAVDYAVATRVAADVPNDLAFLVGLRTRIRLPEADRGPRALTVIAHTVYVGNYFSDTISAVDLATERPCSKSISLGPKTKASLVRKGELYFNDASICFQGWQSCASCHSSDARVDGLNWDNLNDGIGNPKNAKSLLLAHQTPPSMWLGVRSNAFVSVRAGINKQPVYLYNHPRGGRGDR